MHSSISRDTAQSMFWLGSIHLCSVQSKHQPSKQQTNHHSTECFVNRDQICYLAYIMPASFRLMFVTRSTWQSSFADPGVLSVFYQYSCYSTEYPEYHYTVRPKEDDISSLSVLYKGSCSHGSNNSSLLHIYRPVKSS